jgi:hypothetical protein
MDTGSDDVPSSPRPSPRYGNGNNDSSDSDSGSSSYAYASSVDYDDLSIPVHRQVVSGDGDDVEAADHRIVVSQRWWYLLGYTVGLLVLGCFAVCSVMVSTYRRFMIIPGITTGLYSLIVVAATHKRITDLELDRYRLRLNPIPMHPEALIRRATSSIKWWKRRIGWLTFAVFVGTSSAVVFLWVFVDKIYTMYFILVFLSCDFFYYIIDDMVIGVYKGIIKIATEPSAVQV